MDIYFVQQIDNSHVLRVGDPRRRREQRALLATVAVLFLLGFAYAWLRFEMVRLGYEMQTARVEQIHLQQWNRGLELQEASLRDPNRIYSLAQAQLGMQTAHPGQVLALDVAPLPAASTPVQAAQNIPQP